MKKILTIDSSKSGEIKVGLKIGRSTSYLSSEAKVLKSEAVLPLIDKILKQKRLNISELDGIEINTGPGSFTGLRVGIAIANALSFALKIPVNKNAVGELVTPAYEAQPL